MNFLPKSQSLSLICLGVFTLKACCFVTSLLLVESHNKQMECASLSAYILTLCVT